MKSQKGFSLVELLVVVIIIAIVAAIAIPNLLASRRAANEASAISSLRTIHSAEATYFATTGANSAYALIGPATTAGTLSNGGLIDSTLGGGSKSGYSFTSATGTAVYCAKADPQGTSGVRYFAVNEAGVIFQGNATFTCTGGAMAGGGSTAAIQ